MTEELNLRIFDRRSREALHRSKNSHRGKKNGSRLGYSGRKFREGTKDSQCDHEGTRMLKVLFRTLLLLLTTFCGLDFLTEKPHNECVTFRCGLPPRLDLAPSVVSSYWRGFSFSNKAKKRKKAKRATRH